MRAVPLSLVHLLWLLATSGLLGRAQIPFSLGTYSQDFDSLTNSSSGEWVDGETLPGWYAARSAAPILITNYTAGSGTSQAGGLYSFGSVSSTERALGSLSSGSQGSIVFGVRFVNDTPFIRSNIVVSYVGEQWRAGSAALQRLIFSYRVGSPITNVDPVNVILWTPVPELEFVSPNTNVSQAVNGNVESNRVAISAALSGVLVGPGQELFLRWRDVDDASFDHALAVDDLTVTFGEALTNQPPRLGSNRISFVTYNLKGNFASDWTTNAPPVQAIARTLQFLNADIVAMNEIPNGLRYEMTNWLKAFFPDYNLAISPGTDGAIRNGVMTRFSIISSNSWLNRSSLTNFGYDGVFTRDLFEAQLAVPGLAQPLHVFVAHLKSGTSSSDDAARRGAEALAVSNFFVTTFLTNVPQPYVMSGDMNEDVAVPATGSQQPIQRLTNGTGLTLITPVNFVTGERFTHSIQSSNGPSRRYDYVFPDRKLATNVFSMEVFRSDTVFPLPVELNSDDSVQASDHLPVKVVFNLPVKRPFRIRSLAETNLTIHLVWDSEPGEVYAIESTTNLVSGNWMPVKVNYVATNTVSEFNAVLGSDTRFFRVVEQ